MTKTKTYAALLRGINVSGHRKVPMAELRSLLEGLGHTGVRTYLQSGNAVFTTDSGAGEDELRAALEDAIEERFGFRVDCLVRDGEYLDAVAAACPFPAAELRGKELHAVYCSGPVDPERFAAIDREAFLPEEFALGDRVLYLYVPDGLGTSKLAPAVSRPSVVKGLVTTARNWNTVVKLIEMTHEE
ncbi:DUF1697 domain-containing protein [Streptomyces tanashiensis]|uniref:DUF1697 domain-containing protein n=1 Tax=Streptomyces tanashiensis TaxID=67367 RepID=UPI00167E854F|nr:DUF1697 domain-containing protein [Streptomyces tanashiensis]GGY52818.1 hypothetical protein GCM10010299_68730 [Streptomyces tanashiensis]